MNTLIEALLIIAALSMLALCVFAIYFCIEFMPIVVDAVRYGVE